MSINAINGNSFNFGMTPSDPIKPETREKLKALGIDEKSVKTETQAKAKINEKEQEFRKAIQERLQEMSSTQIQTAQAGSQQPQQVSGVDKADKVDGVSQANQIREPKGVENQPAIRNNETGNDQLKAFAAIQTAQKAEPFAQGKDLVAMYNKLKLGLI